MTILKRLMGLMLIGFLTTACSSTTVKNSWVKPGYSEKLDNVYLIGISKEEDYQRIFEENFKQQLSRQGVRAVTSHKELPRDRKNNRENIIQAMTANNCDAVLLTKLIRKRIEPGTKGQEIKVIKATPIPVYYDPWYNSWGTYYDQSYSVVNIQPTTPDTSILTIESVLYDLTTEEKIWAAQLEITKEIDVIKMIHDYVEAVTRNLKGKGLI